MANLRIKRHYSVVAHSPDVVELRYGVWNPVSFTITDDIASGHLFRIISRLDGRSSIEEIASEEGIPKANIEAVIKQLSELKLLEDQSTHALDHYLDQISRNLLVHERKRDGALSGGVLLGDPEVSEKIASILNSSNLGDQYEVTCADTSLRSLLSECGRSWIFDGLDFEEGIRPFAQYCGKFIVFAVTTVNPIEMKALNRICLHYRIPWIHAAIDGPFLLIGPTFVPFRSPCYECLEMRIVMNMRESASYQRYKTALVEGRATSRAGIPVDAVLGAILSSLTAFEALNFLLTSASFTVGKMLSIHLPTMEFTFNEVLRLPGCPSCSPAPECDDKELYFDARILMEDRHAVQSNDNEG